MRKLIILLSLITTAYAQNVVTLNEYEPVQLIGDTLFINKEGYEIVKVIKPFKFGKKKPKYPKHVSTATYYILPTDSINAYQAMIDLKEDVDRSLYWSKAYKKNKCFDMEAYSSEYNVYRTCKIRCINCDWPVEIKRTSKEEDIEKESPRTESIYIPSDILPEFAKIIDSVALLLNYNENQNYSVILKFDGKMDARITVNDECTNYQVTKMPQANINDLEKYLENLSWPILRLDSKVLPYYMYFNYDYTKVSNLKSSKELNNGFKNSIKVFDQLNDSLFAIVDSFNNRTMFYYVNHWPFGLYSSYQTFRLGIIDFNEVKRVDIDNDGFKDLVTDTLREEFTTVNYISNNGNENKSNSLYTRSTSLTFKKALGDHYYYYIDKREDSEWATIYKIVNGERIELISFSKDLDYRGRSNRVTGWEYHGYYESGSKSNEKYTYKTYVLNNKKLSIKTKNPQKAIVIKKEMIRLITHYQEHPELLNVDFIIQK